MRVLDTMVLVGALNPRDPVHTQASEYLDLVSRGSDTFVPLVSILEFDLVMKGRNFTLDERREAFEWLGLMIPPGMVLCNSMPSLRTALNLQKRGIGYFDSLIAAVAIEKDAHVVTTDKAVSRVAKTEW